TNEQDRLCFRKVQNRSGHEFVEINDIPIKGKSLEDAEKPSFASLSPANSDALLFAFRRCHNYIAGNQGLQKPEAFWELLKVIFCKIEDERSDEDTLQFYVSQSERTSMSSQAKVKARLQKLFATLVLSRYPTIFKTNDQSAMPP